MSSSSSSSSRRKTRALYDASTAEGSESRVHRRTAAAGDGSGEARNYTYETEQAPTSSRVAASRAAARATRVFVDKDVDDADSDSVEFAAPALGTDAGAAHGQAGSRAATGVGSDVRATAHKTDDDANDVGASSIAQPQRSGGDGSSAPMPRTGSGHDDGAVRTSSAREPDVPQLIRTLDVRQDVLGMGVIGSASGRVSTHSHPATGGVPQITPDPHDRAQRANGAPNDSGDNMGGKRGAGAGASAARELTSRLDSGALQALRRRRQDQNDSDGDNSNANNHDTTTNNNNDGNDAVPDGRALPLARREPTPADGVRLVHDDGSFAATISIISPRFDPDSYLRRVHRDTPLDALRAARAALDEKARDAEKATEAVLAEHFDRFLICRATVDDLQLRRAYLTAPPPLSSRHTVTAASGANGSAPAAHNVELSLERVEHLIDDRFAPLLRRRLQCTALRRFRHIAHRYAALLQLPGHLRRCCTRGDPEQLVQAYTKCVTVLNAAFDKRHHGANASLLPLAHLIVMDAERVVFWHRHTRRARTYAAAAATTRARYSASAIGGGNDGAPGAFAPTNDDELDQSLHDAALRTVRSGAAREELLKLRLRVGGTEILRRVAQWADAHVNADDASETVAHEVWRMAAVGAGGDDDDFAVDTSPDKLWRAPTGRTQDANSATVSESLQSCHDAVRVYRRRMRIMRSERALFLLVDAWTDVLGTAWRMREHARSSSTSRSTRRSRRSRQRQPSQQRHEQSLPSPQPPPQLQQAQEQQEVYEWVRSDKHAVLSDSSSSPSLSPAASSSPAETRPRGRSRSERRGGGSGNTNTNSGAGEKRMHYDMQQQQQWQRGNHDEKDEKGADGTGPEMSPEVASALSDAHLAVIPALATHINEAFSELDERPVAHFLNPSPLPPPTTMTTTAAISARHVPARTMLDAVSAAVEHAAHAMPRTWHDPVATQLRQWNDMYLHRHLSRAYSSVLGKCVRARLPNDAAAAAHADVLWMTKGGLTLPLTQAMTCAARRYIGASVAAADAERTSACAVQFAAEMARLFRDTVSAVTAATTALPIRGAPNVCTGGGVEHAREQSTRKHGNGSDDDGGCSVATLQVAYGPMRHCYLLAALELAALIDTDALSRFMHGLAVDEHVLNGTTAASGECTDALAQRARQCIEKAIGCVLRAYAYCFVAGMTVRESNEPTRVAENGTPSSSFVSHMVRSFNSNANAATLPSAVSSAVSSAATQSQVRDSGDTGELRATSVHPVVAAFQPDALVATTADARGEPTGLQARASITRIGETLRAVRDEVDNAATVAHHCARATMDATAAVRTAGARNGARDGVIVAASSSSSSSSSTSTSQSGSDNAGGIAGKDRSNGDSGSDVTHPRWRAPRDASSASLSRSADEQRAAAPTADDGGDSNDVDRDWRRTRQRITQRATIACVRAIEHVAMRTLASAAATRGGSGAATALSRALAANARGTADASDGASVTAEQALIDLAHLRKCSRIDGRVIRDGVMNEARDDEEEEEAATMHASSQFGDDESRDSLADCDDADGVADSDMLGALRCVAGAR